MGLAKRVEYVRLAGAFEWPTVIGQAKAGASSTRSIRFAKIGCGCASGAPGDGGSACLLSLSQGPHRGAIRLNPDGRRGFRRGLETRAGMGDAKRVERVRLAGAVE